jgi:hypothetical protein
MPNLTPQHFRAIDLVPAEDCELVNVLVMGPDEWSAQKAIELIAAARQMYDAIGTVSQFLHGCPNDGTDEAFNALLLQLDRAEAAACGGMLAQDRVMKK